MHLGVAILSALILGVDDAGLDSAALLVATSIAHSNAASLQVELGALAALMLLRVMLLHGLFDHGLVLRHVSLATFFHDRSGHCTTSHRPAASSHRRTARTSNRRIDSRTAYQRRSTGQRTHDTTVHLAHRLVAMFSLGGSLSIYMATLLQLENHGRFRGHHFHHRLELSHVVPLKRMTCRQSSREPRLPMLQCRSESRSPLQ